MLSSVYEPECGWWYWLVFHYPWIGYWSACYEALCISLKLHTDTHTHAHTHSHCAGNRLSINVMIDWQTHFVSFYHSDIHRCPHAKTHNHPGVQDSSHTNTLPFSLKHTHARKHTHAHTHTHTHQHTIPSVSLICSLPSQCYLCSLCLLCVLALLPRVMGPELPLFQILSIKLQCRLIKMNITITLDLLASWAQKKDEEIPKVSWAKSTMQLHIMVSWHFQSEGGNRRLKAFLQTCMCVFLYLPVWFLTCACSCEYREVYKCIHIFIYSCLISQFTVR